MKINSPTEDKIIVDLTEQDMLKLDITYEDMDYSTIETRRVIWTLLDEAGKILGRELDPSRRMIIEAMPKSEGGCILSFTILDSRKKYLPKKQFLKKQSETVLCEFDGAEALLNAAECLKSLDFKGKSGLYENGGKYRLIVSGTEDIPKIKSCFSEFGKAESCDALACDYTREHWRELVAENAIEKLVQVKSEE